MKVLLYVEDRDSGFIFLDITNAPSGQLVDLRLDPLLSAHDITFAEINEDDKVVWLQSGDSIRIVPREGFDFNQPFDKEWPIPSCSICLSLDDAPDWIKNAEKSVNHTTLTPPAQRHRDKDQLIADLESLRDDLEQEVTHVQQGGDVSPRYLPLLD